MKKIITIVLVSMVGLLTVAPLAYAATCEEKMVCIDNNHIGFQDASCKITSADEIAKAMGGGSSGYSCYVGCKDGACIKDNTPYSCTDSDGGKDYFVKGNVSTKGNGEQGYSEDYCKDKDNLMEESCSKDSTGKYIIQVGSYKCPNSCVNGACIKVATTGSPTGSTCSDSDGGKDIFKAGIITINGQKQDLSDTCGFDPQTIEEKYCLLDGTYASEDLKCPGLCEVLPSTFGHAYCTNSCEKSNGYYCHKTPDGKYGIGFLNKNCKWDKVTPCQSNFCSNGLCGTMGNLIDTDGDGLLDANETKWGTNPNKFDTDGDGYGDMTEIYGGYNPLGSGKFIPEQTILAGQSASNNPSPIPTVSSSGENVAPIGDLPSDENVVSSGDELLVNSSDVALNNFPSSSNKLDMGMLNGMSAGFVYLIYVIIFLICLGFYAYTAICLQFIARKLNVSRTWMAWIPVANVFLMIKCAERPYWWFLLFFVPIVNIIIGVLLWVYICQRLNHPSWLAILMLVSPLNLIVMGYLAFSRNNSQINYQ